MNPGPAGSLRHQIKSRTYDVEWPERILLVTSIFLFEEHTFIDPDTMTGLSGGAAE